MDLTEIDLDWLNDPARRAEVEPMILQGARFMAEFPPQFERQRQADEILARAEFVRRVATHWPAGPTRPAEVTMLVERFGERGELAR